MSLDTLLGSELDGYRLTRAFRRGEKARLYRAHHLRSGEPAVIKVLDLRLTPNAEQVQAFQEQAKAIANLKHPNILPLESYGVQNGLFYLRIPWIEGASLADLLSTYWAEGSFMQAWDACRLVRTVGLALDWAHQRGVLHYNLTPDNIMLDTSGKAFLTDFALPLLVMNERSEWVWSRPVYVAPELFNDPQDVQPQSDLYSLGVILYEMLTRQLPYPRNTAREMTLAYLTEEPVKPRDVRPAVSEAVEKVMLQALARRPEERYYSGRVMAKALEEALALEADPLPQPSEVPDEIDSMSERVKNLATGQLQQVAPSVSTVTVAGQGAAAPQPVAGKGTGAVPSSGTAAASRTSGGAQYKAGAAASGRRWMPVILAVFILLLCLFVVVALSCLLLIGLNLYNQSGVLPAWHSAALLSVVLFLLP